MISCRKDIPDGIPFTFFTSLIREIAEDTAPKTHRKPQNPLDTFNRWLKRLRKDFSPLPPGTTSIIFRFLFPHEDPRRKYGMQETKLSKELADCLCISDSRLVEWEEKGETVCLGDQLRHIMNPACSVRDPDEICSLSIAKVDALLDELAALSRFASDSIHAKFPDKRCMKRETVLRELFRQMTPFDAACLTQIILRDLRPLMYPLCEKQMHYTSALKELKSNCVAELKIYDAMIAWDPQYALRNSYRVCCSLVDACDAFERDKLITMPSFGVQLEIPKSQKGRSLSHALNFLPQSKKVWAETKYDGERAQIHLKISNRVPKIKIFSKSKRDSTDDRLGVHPVILECLRLEKIESVILDAEMVPFSGEKIEGFWKIRRLIESTARGARRRVAGESESEPETQETQFTQISTEQDCPSQLGLVFFDVMYLNGKSLLTQPYQKRRETLEDLIRVLPGKALLAKRQEIDTNYSQQQGGLASFLLPSKRKATDNVNPETSLGRIFAGTLASHEEGLVLKAAESGYNDWKLPWVKLKQDYIPGLGDTVDLVVVGAGWQKERGMELRVPRNTLITFYIGAQTNKEKTADNPALKPHFRVYFTASYGLTRDELEEANFLVKSNDPIRYKDENILPYDFTLDTDTKPQVLLREPLLADLFGDRFTKAHENAYFGIRWARLTKIYRPAERSWREGLSLSEVQTAALQALGVD
ncbi:DNA ligase/mRNA capping enzyme, partial [Marasmius fiardii PR-910]